CSRAKRRTIGDKNPGRASPFPREGAVGIAGLGIDGDPGAATVVRLGAMAGFPAAGAAPAATAVAFCFSAGAAATAPDAGLAAVSPDLRMTAISTPTGTVVPSSTVIDPIVPSVGAGTSTVILSVMISTTGSSLRTVSPVFLSHFEIVPSAMLSPSWGTTMLTGTFSSCSERETALAPRLRSAEFRPLLLGVEP